MSLLQEIFTWSQGLPPWQSDAVARLLAKETLSTSDYEDLLALLKLDHGIPDPSERKPSPLTANQVPAPAKQSSHIDLLAMKSLRYVNAIAEGQRLAFSATGMTVIYGDNGSGKSGYSRVLKRACRARDQAEAILPDANLPAGASSAPEATFEVSIGGVAQDVLWREGNTPPPELSALSIFDSRCARAYLDREDDFSYVPYGLDVFEGLSSVCKRLKVSIEQEHAQVAPDLGTFALLRGETAVGKMIASISSKTSSAQVESLALLSPDELIQHALLSSSLKESNPKEKANQLRLRGQRIRTISANASSKGALVDDAMVIKLQTMSAAYRSAQEAAALAAAHFKETEHLLPGTGGEAWRELFEAARRYASESHPDDVFPNLGADSRCPLCQQPLAEGASRLLRFEAFIQQDAEKTSQERRASLYAEYKPFVAHSLSLGLDEVTFAEIESLDAQLAADARAFESNMAARQVAVKDAVISQDWAKTEILLNNPTVRLAALADKLLNEAETLEKASDEKVRAALQLQFDELEARIRLSQVKDAVNSAVAKLGHQAKLAKCLSALKTNAISLKASELAEKVVSKDLAAALNNEFKALGVGHLSVSLQSRTDKGKSLHKLKLELPQSRSPSDILSEGEQRAIAIGSFLAEIGLSGATGGIVFDDPVSSLDHRRRERVAARLAREAADRQVIVFTHDIYFLCVLVEEAGKSGVPVSTQSLVRRPEGFGVAHPDLPFEGNNTKKRVGALKVQQVIIAKLFKSGDEQEHRKQTIDAYFRLRMAWERAVEEVLFRGTILRFRKGVETQKLIGVVVEDDDFSAVNAGMTRCSNYAHDKALLGGVAVPDPDELLQDILALETWQEKVNKRGEETAKMRKANPVVAPT
jgi:ABC-type dipeptide/oligopeptide/nickel transport system ATPase subunit